MRKPRAWRGQGWAVHPGPVDAGVVRKLRHHQGASQFPRNVQGNHQKPYRPGYWTDSPHQVDHPRLAEILPGFAHRRAGGAKGVGKEAQGPGPQDCAEYPSNHFLGLAAGNSPKTHRPQPSGGMRPAESGA